MAQKDTNENMGWYGFDFDGTLAEDEEVWQGVTHCGKPIKRMCDLAKRLHSEGKQVKIFTARVCAKSAKKNGVEQDVIKDTIWKWCDENLGFRPDITCEKDFNMVACYDDRATQVISNTGIFLEELASSMVESVRTVYLELLKSEKEMSGSATERKHIAEAKAELARILGCTNRGVPKLDEAKDSK